MRWIEGLLLLLSGARALSDFGSSPQQASFAVPPHDTHRLTTAQETRTKLAVTPETYAFAEKLLAEANVPGLSVGLVHINGSSVTTNFTTWGHMSEDGTAVQPETRFSIGSCSKAFLPSALGILMDDFEHGRNSTPLPPALSSFTWDTKIKDILPGDWKLDDEWSTEKANVRDTLSHVTGLTRHDLTWNADVMPIEVVRRMRFLKTKFELREKWSYNNLMYIMGSHIVSTYSGVPYIDFVKKRIFEPLNMTATTYRWDEAEASGLFSQGWGNNGRRIPYWFTGEKATEYIAGAGGIISNTVDMVKWVAMLLNQGVDPTTNRTIIPRAAFVEMTTSHVIVDGAPADPSRSLSGYGMGWQRLSFLGHDVVTHNGALPGCLSDVAFLPADNVGVVAFINADGSKIQETVSFRILQDILEPESGEVQPSHHSVEDTSASAKRSSNLTQASQKAHCSSGSPPIEHFEGTYTDLGYGSLNLCASTSEDPRCAHILSDWSSISPNGTLDPDTLYSVTKSMLLSHFSMRRTGDTSFDIRLGTIFPEGYGKDTSPFIYSLLPPGEVECVVDGSTVRGCGMMNFEDGPPRHGNTIQERADVWFERAL